MTDRPAHFFKSPAEFRRWLRSHHDKETELWVGFHKVGSGEPSMTWPEFVDEALCQGWIDGLRQRIDDAHYRIRFTPRKRSSIWSAVNIRRMGELQAQGRLQPAGEAAFAVRSEARSGVYSHETRIETFAPAYRALLDAQPEAARFFDAQYASYRRACCNWVAGAKQPATQLRRMQNLIAHCLAGKHLAQFTRR